jgi:hypothetical protein
MVILTNRTACLAVIGIASIFSMVPGWSDACQPSDLLGRVKSVILTEALVDSVTGNIGPARLVLRTDVSENGRIAETTLALSGRSAGPAATATTYYENGRPVRGLETENGKTVPAMTCSYDAQGRLVEARTGLGNREFGYVDTYEYGPGFIRRRSLPSSGGGPSVTTQTLDANGRVIKEVVADEATSTLQRTSEVTYDGNRKEECGVSTHEPRRQCATIVEDHHGNEIEFVAEGQHRKTSLEYDAVGNWVSKRITIIGPFGAKDETIVRRKIEYWP